MASVYAEAIKNLSTLVYYNDVFQLMHHYWCKHYYWYYYPTIGNNTPSGSNLFHVKYSYATVICIIAIVLLLGIELKPKNINICQKMNVSNWNILAAINKNIILPFADCHGHHH